MSFKKVVIFCVLSLTLVEALASIKTAKDFEAEPILSQGSIQTPRGIVQEESGDILVVAKGPSRVYALFQEGNAAKSALIIEDQDLRLNHGITYDKGYIYASNNNTVLRWGYAPGQRSRITAGAEVVVRDIPGDGDHLTRTVIIDRHEFLYVTVGSASNVDQDSSRSQIRRFNLAEGFPSGGYIFKDGELFVDGVRNTVGLAIDGTNNLWGVDCGADELYREDLGGDIHNTNPADKLIQFEKGASYGYPYCWTVDKLFGHSRGQQYAWPTFMSDGVHSDKWCQNTANNRLPKLALPAHNAAVGLTFYDGASCNSSPGSFPCSMKGDIFVAFHGSWNREPASGYKITRIIIDPKTSLPTGETQDIIYESDTNSCVTQPDKCFRPVDLVFDKNGHLIVTSDTSSEIIQIRHKISQDSVIDAEEKRIIIGIIGVVFIALFTGVVIGLIAHKYCYLCCRNKEVPYHRENI